MRLVILNNADQVSEQAARVFVNQLAAKPGSVLGLATGSTPLNLYARLAQLCASGAISFQAARSFNLDEYVGLSPDHPQSYAAFMRQHLFAATDFAPEMTHLPNGLAKDLDAECKAYERRIAAAGGIDLQLLGLGANGHIGFNEPLSSLASRTRVKTLTQDTLDANARFFGPEEWQPQLALTMGIGTVMEARHILILATGASKAEAVKNFVEGPVSAFCPASILQFHPKVTVLVDSAAATHLTLKAYSLRSETFARQFQAKRS